MRISTMMIFDSMLSNLTKAIERTQNIQEVISTGKKINLLSDDPAGIVQVVNYQSDLTKLSQYKENITHGNSWLDMSDSILQDIQNLVGEAKNIAIAQSTSTMNSETRAQAAVVAQNLYEQLIGYGNTRLAGRYIFGGSITDRAPFNANGTYNGNGEDILVEIIEGIRAKINLAGSEFLVTDLNPDLSTAAATSGSTSSTGLTARNINAVLTNPGGSSEYKATFVLTNGLTQEVTYTTDSTPTREELGAGIADAVNNHYTLNQYIRASYDTTTGNITFEAKEAGTEGNQYTIDAANTTAFEGTVNTSFAGGSSEVTSGFVFVGGTNSSIVFRENAGLDINADIITDSGAVSGEVYTGDQVASFIEQSMESKSQTDPNGNSYTYTVSYNETTNLFTIENDATNGGGLGTLTMRWSALNDIGTALGFGAADVGPIAAGGSDVSNNQVEFNILNGVNDLFSISVDGAASVGIDMNAGPETAYTAAGLVVAMNAALPAGATADFGTTITGQFTITSTSTGTGSTVSLTSGADDFLRTVGLDRDFEVSGTSPTPLADLNGGNGVTAGNVIITDREGNGPVNVPVAANQTIDDVITNINGAGVDVTAALNVDGNGITL
ncbi:MAG: flagellar hook-associated protein FlgL, partial [Thermodesulfobacteriota bacterium]